MTLFGRPSRFQRNALWGPTILNLAWLHQWLIGRFHAAKRTPPFPIATRIKNAQQHDVEQHQRNGVSIPISPVEFHFLAIFRYVV